MYINEVHNMKTSLYLPLASHLYCWCCRCCGSSVQVLCAIHNIRTGWLLCACWVCEKLVHANVHGRKWSRGGGEASRLRWSTDEANNLDSLSARWIFQFNRKCYADCSVVWVARLSARLIHKQQKRSCQSSTIATTTTDMMWMMMVYVVHCMRLWFSDGPGAHSRTQEID